MNRAMGMILAVLLGTAALGCKGPARIAPPGTGGDVYYQGPAVTPASTASPVTPPGAINLSPQTLPGSASPALPELQKLSAQAGPKVIVPPAKVGENTYDVASRVAADNQPIRIVDSNGITRSPTSNFAGGMPVNDGTRSTFLGSSNSLPSTSFNGMRGTTAISSRPQQPSGFSGQDGQWRARGSYEPSERR